MCTSEGKGFAAQSQEGQTLFWVSDTPPTRNVLILIDSAQNLDHFPSCGNLGIKVMTNQLACGTPMMSGHPVGLAFVGLLGLSHNIPSWTTETVRPDHQALRLGCQTDPIGMSHAISWYVITLRAIAPLNMLPTVRIQYNCVCRFTLVDSL